MDRRAFIAGGVASAGLALGAPAGAVTRQLGPPTYQGVPMQSYVSHPRLIRQQCELWCWAASVAMIFAHHGRAVNQMRIVQRVFGGVVCASSGNPRNIAAALNTDWVDDYGDAFSCRLTAAYDAFNDVNAITNDFIVRELDADRPVLYGNRNHAMVMVSFDYMRTPNGVAPMGAGVLDPYPLAPGYHPLTYPQMVPAQLGGEMTFLAAVEIY